MLSLLVNIYIFSRIYIKTPEFVPIHSFNPNKPVSYEVPTKYQSINSTEPVLSNPKSIIKTIF